MVKWAHLPKIRTLIANLPEKPIHLEIIENDPSAHSAHAIIKNFTTSKYAGQ